MPTVLCVCVLCFQKRAPADVLFNEVFKHLGLEETDYFGLQYFDNKGITVKPHVCKCCT